MTRFQAFLMGLQGALVGIGGLVAGFILAALLVAIAKHYGGRDPGYQLGVVTGVFCAAIALGWWGLK